MAENNAPLAALTEPDKLMVTNCEHVVLEVFSIRDMVGDDSDGDGALDGTVYDTDDDDRCSGEDDDDDPCTSSNRRRRRRRRRSSF